MLSGRRVVITGAGRGLGRAFAIAAGDEGAEVVLLGRDLPAIAAVAADIEARTFRNVAAIPCDLQLPSSISEACRATLALSPVIDVLINNGAPWLAGELPDLAEADIAATIAATVTGTILLTKGLLPALRQSAAADIVTVVSTAGMPDRDFGVASAAFHAAKHAQAGFSNRLAAELKSQRIRVAAIFPPDFDDTDPLGAEWNATREPGPGARMTNREVVAAIMFAITAPRICATPIVVLDNMSG
jgi:NAD(P)-dependent dehydrogenase (short-subunit alcohol dehydrogenase family)